MEIDITPKGIKDIECSIAVNGLTMMRPEFEIDGMWFMCTWEYGDDKDIYGVCLADGDWRGYREPDDEAAASALGDIMYAVYEYFNSQSEFAIADMTIPEMLWDAWDWTRRTVETYKADPDGPSLRSRLEHQL